MLRVYNFEFELIYIEQKVKSTSWTIYYNGIGTFETHLPLNSGLLEVTSQNKYLVICEDDKAAILTGREIGDELVLYGRTANWILGKRIAPKTESITEQAGTICNNLVGNAFSDVQNFAVTEPCQTESVTVERSTFKPVLNSVSECLALCGAGHSVNFDTTQKKWIFKVYKGTELPLLISEANKNAYDTSASYDILDLADCGYYGENGYLQGQNSGIYRWETVLSGESADEAAISLKEKKENAQLSLKMRGLELGKDYNIGDIVRIQIIKEDWRITEKKLISGVRILKKGGFSEEIPIFYETGGTA
ncbi:MAG: siphovirus ReqiPepy6 Gp37-like family protein [Firmicutes bacterium]|nr:siphovirus ReqiPepy6 Gp37-like family protein [Bacillota bacterium]